MTKAGIMADQGNVMVRDVSLISGGPTDGDSTKSRKAHSRQFLIHVVNCSQEQATGPQINFGLEDLEGAELPYDNAFIIKAVITNNRTTIVFFDTRSSVNVLFKDTFNKM